MGCIEDRASVDSIDASEMIWIVARGWAFGVCNCTDLKS